MEVIAMPAAHKSAISVGLLYIPVSLYKMKHDIGICDTEESADQSTET